MNNSKVLANIVVILVILLIAKITLFFIEQKKEGTVSANSRTLDQIVVLTNVVSK